MNFHKDWQSASMRVAQDSQPLPQRIVTDGLSDGTSDGMTIFFAQARQDHNGTYTVTYSQRVAADEVHHTPGKQNLPLRDVLELLNEWECRHRGIYACHGRETGIDAPHYSDVAKAMNVTLGPEGVSLRHAARLKYTRLKNNKGQNLK